MSTHKEWKYFFFLNDGTSKPAMLKNNAEARKLAKNDSSIVSIVKKTKRGTISVKFSR